MPTSGNWRPPTAFVPDRAKEPGRYPLTEVFPGLLETPPFERYPGDPKRNVEMARASWVRIFDGPGYIYVAPREVPVEIRQAGYNMLTSPDEEIVIAREYLRTGRDLDLYLDVIHEFLHILQRADGRELWPGPTVAYVDRPTEIEAYAFSVAEARRLGVSDAYLREYLRVFWVTKSDHRRLLRHLGLEKSRRRVRRSKPRSSGQKLRVKKGRRRTSHDRKPSSRSRR